LLLVAHKKFSESHWQSWIFSCKTTLKTKIEAAAEIKDEYLSFASRQSLLNIYYHKLKYRDITYEIDTIFCNGRKKMIETKSMGEINLVIHILRIRPAYRISWQQSLKPPTLIVLCVYVCNFHVSYRVSNR
jgi:transcription elongation factor GreA-like protein